MKNDFYLKAVLTVIAICLVLLTIKNVAFVPTANAETKLENTNYALVPINPDGSINVSVIKMPDQVDVNIESCKSWALEWAFGTRDIPVDVNNEVEVRCNNCN